MQKRSIAVCIILSIVTCGIYGLYWLYTIADAFDKTPTQERVSTSPGVTLLLCIITCNIYTIYCFYKWGQASAEIAARHGMDDKDKAILYLVLSIFGLDIINMALVQSDFNDWLDTPGGYGGGYAPEGGTYGAPSQPGAPYNAPPSQPYNAQQPAQPYNAQPAQPYNAAPGAGNYSQPYAPPPPPPTYNAPPQSGSVPPGSIYTSGAPTEGGPNLTLEPNPPGSLNADPPPPTPSPFSGPQPPTAPEPPNPFPGTDPPAGS